MPGGFLVGVVVNKIWWGGCIDSPVAQQTLRNNFVSSLLYQHLNPNLPDFRCFRKNATDEKLSKD